MGIFQFLKFNQSKSKSVLIMHARLFFFVLFCFVFFFGVGGGGGCMNKHNIIVKALPNYFNLFVTQTPGKTPRNVCIGGTPLPKNGREYSYH